jgi:hypothetical protein
LPSTGPTPIEPPVGAALSTRNVIVSLPELPCGIAVSTEVTVACAGGVVSPPPNAYAGESTVHGLLAPPLFAVCEPVPKSEGNVMWSIPLTSVETAWSL